MKTAIRKFSARNPYLKAFKHPEIYFLRMLRSTLWVGIATFIITWIYIHTPAGDVKIPYGIHSMFGFVIAMLLVFRTNTAYDRWWEGRKLIQELKAATYSSYLYLASQGKWSTINHRYHSRNDLFKKYLQSKVRKEDFFKRWGEKTLEIENDCKAKGVDFSKLEANERMFISILTSCERVKDTPIPLAYRIHIKLCVFIYIVTLPFSMFQGASLWSTPLVMFLYFIISGVEIISSEIENPFSGEPNDLPLDELFNDIQF